MNPSALRIRAISIFIRLDGIMTVSCRAPAALRMRVSMSPTGSLTATPRGRRAFGTIVRRGRGASPSVRSGRGVWGSAAFVVTSVVMLAQSPAPLENAPAAGFARRGKAAPRSTLFSALPARLRHRWACADEGSLAEADPAQAELPHVRPGATADLAAVVALRLEL